MQSIKAGESAADILACLSICVRLTLLLSCMTDTLVKAIEPVRL
jgi:hypothetical protein